MACFVFPLFRVLSGLIFILYLTSLPNVMQLVINLNAHYLERIKWLHLPSKFLSDFWLLNLILLVQVKKFFLFF